MLCNSTSCGVCLFSNPHSKVIFGSVYIGVLWHQVKKYTFLIRFFKMFLSNMNPSTFPRAFAPCCIRHRISTSECSSSLTIPPRYTKPSTWLNSSSSKLMFKSSLWCQTHISSVFSRLIIGPCFLNILFHCSNTSCSSCFLSAIMARSFAYIPFLRTSFMLIFLLISATTMIKSKGSFPCL